MKFLICITAYIAMLSIALAQEEVPRRNVSHFARQEGDELIYQARLYSIPTDEPARHDNDLEWESDYKKFTDIVVNVPETVS